MTSKISKPLKDADWERIGKIHTQLRENLRAISYQKKELTNLYSNTIKLRKKANYAYKEANKNALILTSKLTSLSRSIQVVKTEWKKYGGSEKNFYLNVVGNKLLESFIHAKALRKAVILTNPKVANAEFRRLNNQCNEQLKAIKAAKYNFIAIQQMINDNLSYDVVMEYRENAAHVFDIYIAIDRYQLSLRNRKYYIANQLIYIKEDGFWFKLDKAGKQHKITSTVEVRKIESIVNKTKR